MSESQFFGRNTVYYCQEQKFLNGCDPDCLIVFTLHVEKGNNTKIMRGMDRSSHKNMSNFFPERSGCLKFAYSVCLI